MRKSDWESFDDFEAGWHVRASRLVTKDSIYWDGQFDEIPYILWDEMAE